MPRVDVVVESPVARSFRVEQCAGLFDVPLGEKSVERFCVEIPGVPGGRIADCRLPIFDLEEGEAERGSDRDVASTAERAGAGASGIDEAWVIGAIVGPSGSGKSTVARAGFGGDLFDAGAGDWPGDRAVVDGFPAELEMREITGMLSAVGFASPPAWVRPYRVLSNGERFRCDLARALLLGRETLVFDEFTSVVDRQVARVASACVAKAVRQGRSRCKRFVAVTCHYDVLDWLGPDWVLDMGEGMSSVQCPASSVEEKKSQTELALGSSDTGRWTQDTGQINEPPVLVARGWVRRRPEIRLEVRRAPGAIWAGFSRHHYLSHELHPQARCYGVWWEEQAVAFCATLQNFGFRGQRRVHRLVVLPDYQGLSIGTRTLSAVAKYELGLGCKRFSIRTSHPGLIRALRQPRSRQEWRAVDVTKVGKRHSGGRGSAGRCTVGFVFRGKKNL